MDMISVTAAILGLVLGISAIGFFAKRAAMFDYSGSSRSHDFGAPAAMFVFTLGAMLGGVLGLCLGVMAGILAAR